MPEPLPIITIHLGASEYVDICLRKARMTNPDSRVILLGNAENADLPAVREGLAEHFDLTRDLYREDIPELERIYRHFSSLSPIFELFCVKRWFFLRNFLRAEKITRCLHLDSDVLLFCNVTREARLFPPCDMTVGKWDDNGYLLHTAFIFRPEVLDHFTRHILEIYRDETALRQLAERNRKKNGHVWISDMNLFFDFARKNEISLAFLEDRQAESGICFDSRISDVSRFRGVRKWLILRRFKKIFFEDGLPYGILKEGRQKILMKSIHYNGSTKFLMKHHLAGKTPFLPIFLSRWKVQFRRLAEQIATCFKRRENTLE